MVADGVFTWWCHWPRHATETYLAAHVFGLLGAAAGLLVALLEERNDGQHQGVARRPNSRANSQKP
jgi:hypothetical protein